MAAVGTRHHDPGPGTRQKPSGPECRDIRPGDLTSRSHRSCHRQTYQSLPGRIRFVIDGETESVIPYRHSSPPRSPELKHTALEPRVHNAIGYSAKGPLAFFCRPLSPTDLSPFPRHSPGGRPKASAAPILRGICKQGMGMRCREPLCRLPPHTLGQPPSPGARGCPKGAVGSCVPDGTALKYQRNFLYSVTKGKTYGFDLQSGTCGHHLR